MIAWLGVRAQAGAQAAPVRADDAQAAQAAPASLPRRFGQDDARRHTASWAELRYALLPSLSVLGAAEAFTGGSVRTQLIALAGMTLATSAQPELRYELLPSLSMLGAAEAATGCSVRAQLIALVSMTL